MIQFARVKMDVPIDAIRDDVTKVTARWIPHFNQLHYEGDWSVLPLRSPSGKIDQIIPDLLQEGTYHDTPLLHQCPSITNLMQEFGCPLMAVRLMNLKSGSVIREHRDAEMCFEKGEARLHIPVFTNEKVMFYSNETLLSMKEGECWYVNVNLPHRVSNEGPTDRIHLVIDCQVNTWLTELFNRSECTLIPDEKTDADTLNIIRELRMQNTETSNRIADEMEWKFEIATKT